MKYFIYYLPNVTRDYLVNSQGLPVTGKVGYTKNVDHRMRNSRSYGYDISGMEILEVLDTKEEAKIREVYWQREKDCLDHHRNPAVARRASISKTGKKQSESHRAKNAAAAKKSMTKYWDSLSPEDREARLKKIKDAIRIYWQNRKGGFSATA